MFQLDWNYRRNNLIREIIDYDADIICLQEIQSNHFEDFFSPALRSGDTTASSKPRPGRAFLRILRLQEKSRTTDARFFTRKTVSLFWSNITSSSMKPRNTCLKLRGNKGETYRITIR
eukprot:UN00566